MMSDLPKCHYLLFFESLSHSSGGGEFPNKRDRRWTIWRSCSRTPVQTETAEVGDRETIFSSDLLFTVGVRYVPKNNNSKKICFKLGNCGNCGNLLKSLEQQRGHTRSYSSYNLVILVTLVMSVTFGDSILCHPLK